MAVNCDQSIHHGKKTKLCILATVPISIISFYGRQLDYLSDKGFEVTVITSPDHGMEKRISTRSRLVLVPMTRTISPLRDAIAFFRILHCIGTGAFDIVQYSSPKAALLGSVAALLCRVPVRLYLMWGIYYTGQRGIKRAIMKGVERLICFCSTHVAPDSKGNRQFAIEEKLCPAHKLEVVGKGSANGVDLERFNPLSLEEKRMQIRQHYGIPPDACVFGFVGRLQYEKGINELVVAFIDMSRKKQDIYLLLVGPKEGDSAQYMPEVNSALSENPRIICAGYQEHPNEYMAAMDIFVLPSYREGFGIVTIEASAMKLPVITTDIPGPRDAVVNNSTGILVPVKSIASLRHAMEQLFNDPILRKQLGIAGREWAKNFEQNKLWQDILTHRLGLLKNHWHERGLKLKRLMDILISCAVIFCAFSVFILISAAIACTMGRPVLFVQPRPGYKGRIFGLVKFRTMSLCTDTQGKLLPDKERLTTVGLFLRKLSLDELPEVFNVLKGDMSIVGPRPLLVQYLKRYSPEQARRHEVKPGITGWAQINGRNAVNWEEKFKLDVWYVDNRNISLDFKIILMTVYKIIVREGITQPGRATADEFRGKEGL